ncbi:MAG TPA: hypothetical protein VHB79_23515 [Polyangiaceae bacterium]|nr:hypothetical protein [Polyangiaceae bacterium]
MVSACRALPIAALAVNCGPAPAQPEPVAVQVSVDATAPGAPLERVWAFHGYDEVNYTTLPEGRALLQELTALHSAPVHVRNHFLFNTGDGTPGLKWGSTNVYTEDAEGEPVYDWSRTDAILDALTQAGAAPLVELGFMPAALSSHPAPYQNSSEITLNGGCFYPPADYAKWAALVQTWAEHASSRYSDAATSWLWELWNEPDSGYWHGSFDDYAKLYDYTEAGLHAALPDAALGGPAVIDAGGPFLSQFLDHCASGENAVTGARGTRLDLVTFHAKGGVTLVDDHAEMNLGQQLRLHRAGFRAVAASAFDQLPIYITEADPDGCAACGMDILPAAQYRLSPAYGAYELATMKRSLELAQRLGVKLAGLLTWAFTFPDAAYFASYRALSTHGIDLPVLSAFKLLGQLAGASLPLVSSGARTLDDILENGVRGEPDVDGMAALDSDKIRILLWNFHDELLSAPAIPVHLSIKVPLSFGAHPRLSELRVDETHGNAYALWTAQGEPAEPSAAQLAGLAQAMAPAALISERSLGVDRNHSISLELELPRFGVSLVSIEPTTS